MKHLRLSAAFLTLALTALLFAPQAVAQDDNTSTENMTAAAPSTLMSYWLCDTDHLEEVVQTFDTYVKPAAKEVVNEGMLTNWGLMLDNSGDEWNLVSHMSAEDEATLMAGRSEIKRRSGARAEAAGEDTIQPSPIEKHCSNYKDTFYTNAVYVASEQ